MVRKKKKKTIYHCGKDDQLPPIKWTEIWSHPEQPKRARFISEGCKTFTIALYGGPTVTPPLRIKIIITIVLFYSIFTSDTRADILRRTYITGREHNNKQDNNNGYDSATGHITTRSASKTPRDRVYFIIIFRKTERRGETTVIITNAADSAFQ